MKGEQLSNTGSFVLHHLFLARIVAYRSGEGQKKVVMAFSRKKQLIPCLTILLASRMLKEMSAEGATPTHKGGG